MVDVDPQGSAAEVAEAAGDDLPFDFTTESDPGVLGQLRKARDIDTVIIDCPGSLEGQDVLGQVLAAADLVIIPMVPERAAITPLRSDSVQVSSWPRVRSALWSLSKPGCWEKVTSVQ